MKHLKFILCACCFYTIVLGAGCVIVPGGPFAVEEVIIDVPPPPPPAVVVTRPPRPSSLHIWIEGHYIVSGGNWVWISGRWEQPQRKGLKWMPPQTRPRGKAWGWTPGRWR